MPLSICIVPVCAMRAEPAHRSEQVSQLLFGEVVELLDETKDFTKVKALYDHYEGWCQTNQLGYVGDVPAVADRHAMVNDWSGTIMINNTPMHVSLGSSLGFLNDGAATIGKYTVSFDGSTWQPGVEPASAETIKAYAFKYINTSYQWGGKSVFGIDCSGFTQMVFKFCGIHLHRDAYQQATQGEAVGFIQEAQCGDLAFFDNEEGRITHVGIMLDAQTIIHASGKVRVDPIDHSGIIQAETGIRTHRLRIINRLL